MTGEGGREGRRKDHLAFLRLSAWGSDSGTGLRWSHTRRSPTCVVEEGGDEGAVLEEGVAGGDIFKETLLEQRILEHHRPHLQVHESGQEIEGDDWSKTLAFRLRCFHHQRLSF